MHTGCPVAVLVLLSFALAVPSGAGALSPQLADCEARFAAAPDAEESVECFYDAGRAPELSAEASRRVEALLSRHPDHPWLLFYLGHLRWAEPRRAEQTYRDAAAVFARTGDATGEIRARTALHMVLIHLGRPGEAEREVDRATAIAKAGDPLLKARASLLQARHLRLRGGDLERAYVLLHQSHDAVFDASRDLYPLQRDFLEEMAGVSFSLGRIPEARAAYGRLANLARTHGERRFEVIARYGVLRGLVEELAEMPRTEARRETTKMALEILALASELRIPEITGRVYMILGQLSSGAEAHHHIEQCLATLHLPADRSQCLVALSRQIRRKDPARAVPVVTEALTLADQSRDPWVRYHAWRERMRVSWATLPSEKAAADSRTALRSLEVIREQQKGASGRAGLFSLWSEDYYWLSGRLLQDFLEHHHAGSLDEAFSVTERLRARTLVEALQAARAAPVAPPKRLAARHSQVLEKIAQVQRRLLEPTVPATERASALRELRRLEIEEDGIEDQIASAGPRVRAQHPGFATLAEVRSTLAPDEALLSFQIAPDEGWFGDFAGGSWLLAVTRGGTRVYRLSRDRVSLRPAVSLLDGLFERRDGTEAAPAAGLYRNLLGDALRDLPLEIRKLVILPDDALHQLPFAALRPEPGAAPLAGRYQIAVAPSATLWLKWRKERPPLAAEPLLALADPVLPGTVSGRPEGPTAERSAVFAAATRLGALPFARREGRAAARYLGGGSVLRMGHEASEGFLKNEDLRRFRVLHFATHAVLDDQNTERSGVLLTPAPATEDGLLQLREIVPLRLDGQIAVLSSCRSASGTMLRGEGMMGLARAFFQAGAHAVVASLWPLRDDDGAALFDRFYRHLAQGKSAAAALRAAQLDRIEDGAPAYAWAGLVVLGDGDLVPIPGGRKWLFLTDPRLLAGAGIALLGLVALMVARLRPADRQQHAP